MQANEAFPKFLNELKCLMLDLGLILDFYQENDKNYVWLKIVNFGNFMIKKLHIRIVIVCIKSTFCQVLMLINFFIFTL